MKNKMLLTETLFLLIEIKSKHGNTDNCVSKGLDQAIKNLEEIQEDDSQMPRDLLNVLGKLVSHFPEIQKILDYLAEL